MKRPVAALGIAVALALFAGAVEASADTAVLPQELGLPWSDPNHAGPFENLASGIASTLAGRTVRIRCEGDTAWRSLAAQYGFDPTNTEGYVPRFPHYVPDFWYFVGGIWIYRPGWVYTTIADFAELSPQVCGPLQTFAQAATKPTKCSAVKTETATVYKTVRYKAVVPVRVKTRVRVKAKWVVRTVTVRRTVWKTKQVPEVRTTTTTGSPLPCYEGDASTPYANHDPSALPANTTEPASYWNDYDAYALALLTLAHEPFHLGGVTDEGAANCYGVQSLAWVAAQLGATADDAEQIALYAYRQVMPRQPPQYNSSSCYDGGPLDLRPDSTVWP